MTLSYCMSCVYVRFRMNENYYCKVFERYIDEMIGAECGAYDRSSRFDEDIIDELPW